jgi:hypothetical protein
MKTVSETVGLDDARLQDLVLRAEQMEKRARKRATAYTVVPAIAAVLLIVFTGQRVRRAQQELAYVNSQLAQRQSDLQAVTDKLNQKQQELNGAKSALDVANTGAGGLRRWPEDGRRPGPAGFQIRARACAKRGCDERRLVWKRAVRRRQTRRLCAAQE